VGRGLGGVFGGGPAPRNAPGIRRSRLRGGRVRIGIAILLAACVVIGGVFVSAPSWLTALAASEGIAVDGLRWCPSTAERGAGLCADRVARGGTVAEGVTFAVDRTVHAQRVRVAVGGADGAAGDAASAPASGAGTPSERVRAALGPAAEHLRAIDVDAVEITVGDVRLPVVGGRVWPALALAGERLSIEGDAVRGTVDTPLGPLAVEVRPDAGDAIDVRATCAPCVAPAGTLDRDAVPLPDVRIVGVLEGRTSFDGTVEIGEVRAELRIARGAAGGKPPAPEAADVVRIEVTLPETPLSAAYGIVAAGVPEVARARIGGVVSATARARWSGAEGLVVETVSPALRDVSVDGLVPESLREGRFQYRAPSAEGPVLRTAGEGTPDWVPLAAMGPLLPAAVVAAEDGGYWSHPGYALDGMLDAFRANAEAGEVVRGGSTLTQQLAKNLFLDGERTYARKLRELLYAVALEQELGKRRILELYLNVVELGPRVWGAGPATRTYFVKRPEGLLPEEAAFLAGILRNPRTAWRTQYLRDTPASGRVAFVVRNMAGLDSAAREAALARPIRFVPP
jgi:hypothetical protein